MKSDEKARRYIEAQGEYEIFGQYLFQHAVLNSEVPVRILSQNDPHDFQLHPIKSQFDDYTHKFFHLTGAIRKHFSGTDRYTNYASLINMISKVVNLPGIKRS